MKKLNTTRIVKVLFILAVFVTSCSPVKYAHLHKIHREQVEVPEASVLNERESSLVNNDAPATGLVQENTVESVQQNLSEVKPATTVNKIEKEVIAKVEKPVKKSSLKMAMANKIMKKLPAKIMSVVAEKKNIASSNSTSDNSKLLWTIIIIALVLLLLGLLGPGSIASLIWLALAVLLVVFLLRLLGVL